MFLAFKRAVRIYPLFQKTRAPLFLSISFFSTVLIKQGPYFFARVFQRVCMCNQKRARALLFLNLGPDPRWLGRRVIPQYVRTGSSYLRAARGQPRMHTDKKGTARVKKEVRLKGALRRFLATFLRFAYFIECSFSVNSQTCLGVT